MATEQQIHDWIYGVTRDFAGECQALMWQLAAQFGTVVSTPPSAIDAYYTEANAGRIGGGTPPPGSFVYWDIGTYGHVGFMMNGGRIFMGSTHVVEQWSQWNTGWNTLDGYHAATGAGYLGWSWTNGGNAVAFESDGGDSGGGGGAGHQGNTNNSPVYGDGDGWEFWVPAADLQARVQAALQARGRYDGPVDGAWGPNTVAGIQETCQNVGYTGPLDGVAGANTCYYVQVYAQQFGDYSGPVDQVLGQASWEGFALGLERP